MKMVKLFFLILLHFSLFFLCVYSYFKYIKPILFHASPQEKVLGASVANNGSSHSLIPIVSNQWFSSICRNFPTSPLYALPLVYNFSSSGMGFSYPSVKATPDEITAPYTQDFTIGTKNEVMGIKPVSIGDWTVKIEMQTSDNNYIDTVIGHGLPFATIDTNSDQLTLSIDHPFQLSDGMQPITQNAVQISSFLLTINTNKYLFSFETPVRITQTTNQILLQNPQHIFIGLLDSQENYALFKQIADVRILDSQSFPSITTNALNIQYKITDNGTIPLIALYPHQFDNLADKTPVLGEYQTIRGPLRLVKTDNFTTSIPLLVPAQTYQTLSKNYPDLTSSVDQEIASFIKKGKPPGNDYYLGTWFGEAADLLQLADTLGEKDEEGKLLRYIEPIFYTSLQNFYYDKDKTSLIAKYPEFGNENLNDHHFHYGYYIRLAAVLASLDLPSLQRTQPQIDQMVADIATSNRTDTRYPFLRNFDIYESHSWADGFGATEFGNNQESTSEAINAWYALYLWSQVTNNETLRQTALYLYNAEILGANYYWFDKTNIYQKPYMHAIASRVWGGKIDFQTWFSGKTNMKYGIQLLPLTPGSWYLSQLQNNTKYITDVEQNGGSIEDSWGDLLLMFASFYNPVQALQNKGYMTQPETDNPYANFLYFLYKNNENMNPPQ